MFGLSIRPFNIRPALPCYSFSHGIFAHDEVSIIAAYQNNVIIEAFISHMTHNACSYGVTVVTAYVSMHSKIDSVQFRGGRGALVGVIRVGALPITSTSAL